MQATELWIPDVGVSEPRPSVVDFELLLRRALGVLEILRGAQEMPSLMFLLNLWMII